MKTIILGVSDAGVHALAGPIVATAVAYFEDDIPPMTEHVTQRGKTFKLSLTEYKKLSQLPKSEQDAARTSLSEAAISECLGVCSVFKSANEIDRVSSKEARTTAFRTAIRRLYERLCHDYDLSVFVKDVRVHLNYRDSLPLSAIPFDQECDKKFHDKDWRVAAASLISKVKRDQYMRAASQRYPVYGWNTSMGYDRKKNFKSWNIGHSCETELIEHGLTPEHRKSFNPIRTLIEEGHLKLV